MPGLHQAPLFFVASGVSRIIILRRACEKVHKIREFEPTHVGCYVMIDEPDATLHGCHHPREIKRCQLADEGVRAPRMPPIRNSWRCAYG